MFAFRKICRALFFWNTRFALTKYSFYECNWRWCFTSTLCIFTILGNKSYKFPKFAKNLEIFNQFLPQSMCLSCKSTMVILSRFSCIHLISTLLFWMWRVSEQAQQVNLVSIGKQTYPPYLIKEILMH